MLPMTVDLWSEFLSAVPRLRRCHLDRLAALGIGAHEILAAGNAGMARIRRHAGGLYEPDDTGDPALIVPIFLGEIPAPGNPVAEPILDDLIAWHPDRPNRWALRAGTAVTLGNAWGSWPLPIHRTPLDWLRAGGAGVVILDWVGAFLRFGDSPLLAQDLEHGQEIRERLTRPVPCPPILVPNAAKENLAA